MKPHIKLPVTGFIFVKPMETFKFTNKKQASMKRYKLIIAVVLLVSSIILLFSRLSTPQPIQIVLETGQEITTQTPNYYPLYEVLLLVIASFIIGATAIYLFYNSDQVASIARKEEKVSKDKFRHIANMLKRDEKKVFDILLGENGEMLQNRLVSKTGLSKVSVTRALTKLETKSLIIKERYGLTNKIKLKAE